MVATTSLQSLHQPLLHRRHHHHHHHSFPSTDSIPFLKTTTSQNFYFNLSSSSLTTTSSVLTPSTATTTATSSSFDILAQHLSASDFRQADEETRRLLIALAGEAAQKRGYVFFSEVQFISAEDLQAIDRLWRRHSNNRLGYSVQKRLWEKSKRDFTKFFIKLGWMKRLDTDMEQYNYRSFPTEFIWELSDDMPEGHLPLTNALRGTRLLGSILTHPAFEEESLKEEEEEKQGVEKGAEGGRERPDRISGKRSLKPDYSF